MIVDYPCNFLKWVGFSRYISRQKLSQNKIMTHLSSVLQLFLCAAQAESQTVRDWNIPVKESYRPLFIFFFFIVFFWTLCLKEKFKFVILERSCICLFQLSNSNCKENACRWIKVITVLQCILYFMLAKCLCIHHLYVIYVFQ